jgi:hypothetical protein
MAIEQSGRYRVSPFSGARYHENARRAGIYEPCGICGKAVKAPTHRAVVVDGGGAWGDERSDTNDPGYMGTFPIGSDCHRKHVLR